MPFFHLLPRRLFFLTGASQWCPYTEPVDGFPTAYYNGGSISLETFNGTCFKTAISGETGGISGEGDSTIRWQINTTEYADPPSGQIQLTTDTGSASASVQVLEGYPKEVTITDLFDSNDYGITTETLNISYSYGTESSTTTVSFSDYTISGSDD